MKLFQKLINLVKQLKSMQIKSVLNGKEINLTGDNTTIKSNNFNVDKDGNMSCKNATMESAKIEGGNLKMWGNTTLDGVRVFQDSSKDVSYMAYMVSDVVGVNKGDERSAMMSNYIGTGNSSMLPNEIRSPIITQTSLEKNKKNFKKLEDKAIEIIKNIDIYKYNLKSEKDTDKKHIGFVIGDNYNYSKEVTSLDNTGVDNYSFTSLCCKAIQEQQKIIEKLQNKIEEMEEKINGQN